VIEEGAWTFGKTRVPNAWATRSSTLVTGTGFALVLVTDTSAAATA
jgi:hypothetical protein